MCRPGRVPTFLGVATEVATATKLKFRYSERVLSPGDCLPLFGGKFVDRRLHPRSFDRRKKR